jgi:hypothetical protein
VIFFARYEASKFGSMTIEAEHLLLGVLREDRNLTHRFLGTEPVEGIRDAIRRGTPIREKVPTSIDLPLSNESKRILAYAAEETERLNHRYIGTEHILLGILREENCLAAKILYERGLKLEAIREELARAPMPPEPATSYDLGALHPIMHNVALPSPGVVPDADTAIRIAQAVFYPVYGSYALSDQIPLQAELKFNNVWIVTGSPASGKVTLFVFIHKPDGRILHMGCDPPLFTEVRSAKP